jgi:hypothetical protein
MFLKTVYNRLRLDMFRRFFRQNTRRKYEYHAEDEKFYMMKHFRDIFRYAEPTSYNISREPQEKKDGSQRHPTIVFLEKRSRERPARLYVDINEDYSHDRP